MLIAKDKNGNRVHIDDTIRGKEYICPICDELLIVRKGNKNIHHFAHKINTQCLDCWTSDKTQWHIDWQNRFPRDCQEVVKEYNGEKHRADVLLEDLKIVIEFQNSRINSEEFSKRNEFYNRLGYKVIWVFNVVEKYRKKYIRKCEYERRFCLYEWKRGLETFFQLDARNENVIVFLQIKCFPEEDEIIEQYIEDGEIKYDKIMSCFNGPYVKKCENDRISLLKVIRNSTYLKKFCVEPKEYTLRDFMDLFFSK